MTDQPWNQQPKKPEASAIIPPTDEIVITIDNFARGGPKASYRTSRPLPFPVVIDMFLALGRQAFMEFIQAQTAGLIPPGNPPAGKMNGGG